MENNCDTGASQAVFCPFCEWRQAEIFIDIEPLTLLVWHTCKECANDAVTRLDDMKVKH